MCIRDSPIGLIIPEMTSKIKSSKFVFVRLESFLKNIFESLEIIIDNKIPIKKIEIAKSKFSVNNFISNKFLNNQYLKFKLSLKINQS